MTEGYNNWKNEVEIVGRVGGDPTVRTTSTGTAQAFFDIVWSPKANSAGCWFSVSCFDQMADRISRGGRLGDLVFHPVLKGDLVRVTGRLFSHKKRATGDRGTFGYNAVLINAYSIEHVSLGKGHGERQTTDLTVSQGDPETSEWDNWEPEF